MRLVRELDKETEARLKKAVFVGRMATKEELAYSFLEAPVKFQDELEEFLLFHIKCISDIPDEIAHLFQYHNRIFRGSTRTSANIQKIRSQLLPNFDRMKNEVRRAKLEEALQDKLVLFNLQVSGINLFLDLLKIERAAPEEEYSLIPGPLLQLQEKRSDFEDRIRQKRPIVLSHYPNLFQDPEFLYCDQVLYSGFTLKASANPTTYYVENPDDVRVLEAGQAFLQAVELRYDDSMFVVAKESRDKLLEEMEKEGRALNEAPKLQRSAARKTADRNRTAADSQAAEGSIPEHAFLEKLEENAKLRGLYYDSQDLYNFHTSVKTNLLTIIGGMSGTGKSQLALLYGETLGLDFGGRLQLVPVSPAYHEPNDILGYLNPATGIYHESETGLVSLLMHAEKSPDQLYMVIFDEMNLSQVEHWFSPFISLLELEPGKRQLTLYHSDISCKNGYPAKVNIGDNVMFVGTVNFDETTKGFSHRLLDRANVMTPRKLTFREVREFQVAASDRKLEATAVARDTFREGWMTGRSGELSDLTDREIDLLDQLHEELQHVNSQQGISFRAVRGIAHFLENIPASAAGRPLIDRGKALDIQVMQRVLTKISGMQSTIEPLVGRYDGLEYQEGRIAGILLSVEAQQLSTFKQSLEMLKKKAKELMIHGFAY